MTDQDFLILEEPEFLKNLELAIGETIPILNDIKEDSFGIQIKNKKIIGLGLANCNLTDFPEPIAQISTLEILTLMGNKIIKIPQSIGNLTSLISLNMKNNKLERLPDTFWRLKTLKNFNIEENNLKDEWSLIQDLDATSVLEFCRGNAPLNLYIAFPSAFGLIYRIEEFIRSLKSNKEILEIYQNDVEKVAESHILLLFCTKNSRNEDYFIESMSIAITHHIEIIPIKDTSIDWDDLNQIDLSKKGLGDYDLGHQKGFTITRNNVRSLSAKIYDYIIQYKRKVNLLGKD